MSYKYYLITILVSLCILILTIELTKNSSKLLIMSYNIRYDNPDDAPNNWDNRKEQVANLIRFYEPAFVGTQEGLLHQLEYLEEELNNYKWIGVGRDDGSVSGEFSALFYDTTKVELIAGSEQTIWLSETPSKPSKSWDAALPRILTYGQFRDQSSGRQLFVFNTHFDHQGDTARAKSAEMIVNKIDAVAGDSPAVVTGDFNIIPESKPYAILTSDRSPLQDAFDITAQPHLGPLFTFEGFHVRSGSEKRRIDYIFVNDEIQVIKHAIISNFRDTRYPSDHLPVISEITLAQ